VSLNRGITQFKKGYQPGTKLVKDKNGDLLVESHIVFNRWKNYFCHQFIVLGINNVRQTASQP